MTLLKDPAHAWGELIKHSKLRTALSACSCQRKWRPSWAPQLAHHWGGSFVVNDLMPARFAKAETRSGFSRLTSLGLFVFAAVVTYFFVDNMVSWFMFINSAMVIFLLPLAWVPVLLVAGSTSGASWQPSSSACRCPSLFGSCWTSRTSPCGRAWECSSPQLPRADHRDAADSARVEGDLETLLHPLSATGFWGRSAAKSRRIWALSAAKSGCGSTRCSASCPAWGWLLATNAVYVGDWPRSASASAVALGWASGCCAVFWRIMLAQRQITYETVYEDSELRVAYLALANLGAVRRRRLMPSPSRWPILRRRFQVAAKAPEKYVIRRDLHKDFWVDAARGEESPVPRAVAGRQAARVQNPRTKGWMWTPQQTMGKSPCWRATRLNFFMNCYGSMSTSSITSGVIPTAPLVGAAAARKRRRPTRKSARVPEAAIFLLLQHEPKPLLQAFRQRWLSRKAWTCFTRTMPGCRAWA